MLAGTGKNPNIGAAIFISLGCEVIDPTALAEAIRATGKRVEVFDIQSIGGSIKAIQHGTELARTLLAELTQQPKVPVPLNKLKVAVKCGGSDATSGLASNPALGVAADTLIHAGGSIVIGETTEIIGAEHIMARRCASPETSDVDVSPMLDGTLLLEQAGELIWQEICEVAEGKLTKAEILGHQEFSINRIGPSL